MTENPSADVQAPHAAHGGPAAGASHVANGHQETQAHRETQNRQQTQATRTTQARQGTQARQAAPAKRPRSRRNSPAPRPVPRPAPERRVRIGSPTALLAVVPVLLGFEPSSSMVVIGTEQPRAQVRLTLRYDLPNPPDARLAAELARHATGVLSAQRIEAAVAVGYGPGHLVSPVADALREHAPRAGITMTELLRAEDERYWSYLCTEPGCCPPEGTPFDTKDHPAVRAMAAEGVRVLASREDLAATVAPADGELAEVMRRATRKAEEHAARLIARVARSGRKRSARRLIAISGLQAVAEAIDCYRGGDRVGPEQAAWLTVVLRDLRVRDDAWSRMLPEHREAHLRLWTDLTRMARPGYVPAPASLLALAKYC
jgi:Domain of unknown function (DUF4192)